MSVALYNMSLEYEPILFGLNKKTSMFKLVKSFAIKRNNYCI